MLRRALQLRQCYCSCVKILKFRTRVSSFSFCTGPLILCSCFWLSANMKWWFLVKKTPGQTLSAALCRNSLVKGICHSGSEGPQSHVMAALLSVGGGGVRSSRATCPGRRSHIQQKLGRGWGQVVPNGSLTVLELVFQVSHGRTRLGGTSGKQPWQVSLI